MVYTMTNSKYAVFVSQKGLSVCGRMPIFISVTSSIFKCALVTGTVSIPYSIAGWTIILFIFPCVVELSYRISRKPDIFLQLFHPHLVLLLIFVLMSPSLCRVVPIYLNSMTCGSLAYCILTLPHGVPFRHMYSVLCLCSCHFHSSLLQGSPPTAPITTPARISPLRTAPHHLRTKSANVLFPVSESIMMKNRKGLKADPWWSPTSTA